MTTYDQKNFKLSLQKLENKIHELSQKIPRQKFRFKRRKNKEVVQNWDEIVMKEEELQIKGIVDQKGVTIDLTQSDLDNNFKLENLEDCVVNMTGVVKMLFLNNIKNCKLNLCPAENSVMINVSTNSEINMVGQQIRIHDSYDNIYGVFTTSKLIIEGSKRLKFKCYEASDDLMAKSGFKGKINLWKDVQDFDWIKQEQSPNFEIIN